MRIEEEIKQKKFKSEYHKAHINILFTAAWLSQHSVQLLKPFNISWQQFNVLRILRGIHPESASVKLLTERMIDKMSNASRLVEKLKRKGLVDRQICPEDRRRVDVFITDKGLDLVNQASAVMEEDLQRVMSSISREEAVALNQILDTIHS